MKGVNRHLQVSHAINFGSQSAPDSYHFSPTYLGPKRISPAEVCQMLLMTRKVLLLTSRVGISHSDGRYHDGW